LLVLNFGELKLGLNSDTIAADGKPVSALCHGPWARLKAEVVEEVASPLGLSSKLLFTMQELSGWSRRWW